MLDGLNGSDKFQLILILKLMKIPIFTSVERIKSYFLYANYLKYACSLAF